MTKAVKEALLLKKSSQGAKSAGPSSNSLL